MGLYDNIKFPEPAAVDRRNIPGTPERNRLINQIKARRNKSRVKRAKIKRAKG